MGTTRVMGIETEYGIAVPGDPHANPMLISSQIVNGYATGEPGLRHARWDYEEENPLRDARGFTSPARPPTPASSPTRTSAWPTSSSPTVRGSTSTTRTLSTPARRSRTRATCSPGTRPGELVMAEAAQRAARVPGAPADQPLQEQHRQQGRLLRHARELPHASEHPLPRDRQAPDAVLRLPSGDLRAGTGRPRPGGHRRTASRSASEPTSSRSRSGWRPPSSVRSSTPATSRTPTRTSTGGCTSSSATRTWPRSPDCSRSAPPRSCWR